MSRICAYLVEGVLEDGGSRKSLVGSRWESSKLGRVDDPLAWLRHLISFHFLKHLLIPHPLRRQLMHKLSLGY